MQILIFKRHKNGTLSLVHESESKVDRDVETSVTLGPGRYIIVPNTTGGRLRAPKKGKKTVPFKVEVDGVERTHALYLSTFNNLFSKLDLQLNGQLSIEEINQFGQMIHDEELQNLTQEDLSNEKYTHVS
jgi:hypothetical protein